MKSRIFFALGAFFAMLFAAKLAAGVGTKSRCCFCESLPPSCMNGETYVPEKLKCVDGEWR